MRRRHSHASDEDFTRCIQEWIEVDQWLRLIAAESLLPTLEDLVGARRNFYLYFQPEAAAPTVGSCGLGWDYDTALGRQTCNPKNCDPFTAVSRAFENPRYSRPKLVKRLTRVFKSRYCELMNTFLRDVYLPEKVDEMAEVIRPVMLEDSVLTAMAEVFRPSNEGDPVGADAWQAAVTEMRISCSVTRRTCRPSSIRLPVRLAMDGPRLAPETQQADRSHALDARAPTASRWRAPSPVRAPGSAAQRTIPDRQLQTRPPQPQSQ